MKNIQWARENGFPCEKMQKLNEREEKCIQLKTTNEPEFNLWDFLKLSYSANSKIPFIAECLELKNTKKYDRGIFTTEDLNAGDIIAIERPALSFLCEEGRYHRCCRCCKSLMLNLIPCSRNGE